MIKINRQKAKQNKLPIAMLLAEFVTAILAVYLFYKLLGFKFDFTARAISIAPNPEPMLLFFFVIAVVLLVDTYFVIKRRFPQLFQAQQLAKGTIRQKTREKLSRAKSEPRAAALLLIEFAFVFAVALTIVAWLDPELELVPWGSIGIKPPLNMVLNAVLAITGLAFFYYLYSFTAWYRKG